MRVATVCTLAAVALALGSLPGGGARAASAVAASVDNFGYCYQMQDARAAVACALKSCGQRSRQRCHLVASCARGGYGAVFLRLLPGRTIESIGAACGARSRRDAFRLAAQRCNRRANSNACRGPHGAWFDRGVQVSP
ncbi:MAG: hypothetical protein QNJ94_16655 [Alphaproteobacteria bacterium]|nr:hypothetical protein [Alphaproteobacteria bacterium]